MAAPAKASRETILDAIIRLFQKQGFSGLGMRQIAQSLNIQAPSLYYHFASKEEIAQQALRQYSDTVAARLQALEGRGDLADQLRFYVEYPAQMLADGARPCLYLTLVAEPIFQSGPCAEELNRFVEMNLDWLAAAIRGSGRKLPGGLDDRRMAEILFGSFEGMIAMSLADQDPAAAFRRRTADLILLLSNVLAS
jgi:TetR/AcrR family transcriptional regulator, transcriptional repressor for nem operon